jgi:hypothetical protein
MAFFDAQHHSKIVLTQEEMLTISQEISLKFSPQHALLIDHDFLAPNTLTDYNDQLTEKNSTNADWYSTPDGDCCFSAKELNAISEEISRSFAPKSSILKPEVFLLPVDPYHLYAYWALGDSVAPGLAASNYMSPITLRIYWRPDYNPAIKQSNVWFDVNVESVELRSKVRLPLDDTAYSASLGRINPDHSFDVIADSNIIHVPPAPGRMRIAPVQQLQNHQSDDANVQSNQVKASDKNKVPIHENWITTPDIKGVFYEKAPYGAHFPEQSWFVKLHFTNWSNQKDQNAKIDSQLMAILNAKGIDIELIHEPDIESPSNYYSKSASGQGI